MNRWSFDLVWGVNENRPPKPNPTGAISLAKELELDPREMLYLGDTNTDMQTANAAGMYAVGVLWGFRKADELKANNARTLISTPPEAMELLSAL